MKNRLNLSQVRAGQAEIGKQDNHALSKNARPTSGSIRSPLRLRNWISRASP